jgi:hypothetical protein
MLSIFPFSEQEDPALKFSNPALGAPVAKVSTNFTAVKSQHTTILCARDSINANDSRQMHAHPESAGSAVLFLP